MHRTIGRWCLANLNSSSFLFFMLFIFSPQNNCDRKEQNQERKKDRENREGEMDNG